jgi:small subunit ribosomal protein S6
MTPELSEEEHAQTKTKFTDIVENMSGRFVKVDDWGRRRLAYPVEKQMYGMYLLMDYMGTPELLTELERNLRIDERVWKHMTLILDKDFTEAKYESEIERIKTEAARREAERAQRDAERAQREADAAGESDDEDRPGSFRQPDEEPEGDFEEEEEDE